MYVAKLLTEVPLYTHAYTYIVCRGSFSERVPPRKYYIHLNITLAISADYMVQRF